MRVSRRSLSCSLHAAAGAIFVSFLFVPYDAFGLFYEASFWSVPIVVWFVALLWVVAQSWILGINKHAATSLALYIVFIGWYTATLLWSPRSGFPLDSWATLLAGVFFYWFFLRFASNQSILLRFSMFLFLIFLTAYLLFFSFHGLSAYRMVYGVTDLNPAFIGLASGYLFLLALVTVRNRASRGRVVATVSAMPVFLIVLIATQARLAIIGVALALLVYLAQGLWALSRAQLNFNMVRSFALVIAVVGVGVIAVLYLWDHFEFDWARLAALGHVLGLDFGLRNVSIDAGRGEIWRLGWRSFDHVLWGEGFGAFAHQVGSSAHNGYLLIFYESGLIGLSIFAVFLSVTIKLSLNPATSGLWAYLLVFGMGNDQILMPIFFCLSALTFWIGMHAKNKRATDHVGLSGLMSSSDTIQRA